MFRAFRDVDCTLSPIAASSRDSSTASVTQSVARPSRNVGGRLCAFGRGLHEFRELMDECVLVADLQPGTHQCFM